MPEPKEKKDNGKKIVKLLCKILKQLEQQNKELRQIDFLLDSGGEVGEPEPRSRRMRKARGDFEGTGKGKRPKSKLDEKKPKQEGRGRRRRR